MATGVLVGIIPSQGILQAVATDGDRVAFVARKHNKRDAAAALAAAAAHANAAAGVAGGALWNTFARTG